MRQLGGGKCLIEVRSQRRMGRVVRMIDDAQVPLGVNNKTILIVKDAI